MDELYTTRNDRKRRMSCNLFFGFTTSVHSVSRHFLEISDDVLQARGFSCLYGSFDPFFDVIVFVIF